MRAFALGVAFVLFCLCTAAANPRGGGKRTFYWELVVSDSQFQPHKYAVDPNGGTIPVDLEGWHCTYDKVLKVGTSRFEIRHIHCLASQGGMGAVVEVACGPNEVDHSPVPDLMIEAGNKNSGLFLKCRSM